MNIVIEVSGGLVTAVYANGECDVTLVDHDNIDTGEDQKPDLPNGMEWDRDGTVRIHNEGEETSDGELWSEVL